MTIIKLVNHELWVSYLQAFQSFQAFESRVLYQENIVLEAMTQLCHISTSYNV